MTDVQNKLATVWVISGLKARANGEHPVALWEQNVAHPDGEAYVAGDKPVEVALTPAVVQKIRNDELIEVDTPPKAVREPARAVPSGDSDAGFAAQVEAMNREHAERMQQFAEDMRRERDEDRADAQAKIAELHAKVAELEGRHVPEVPPAGGPTDASVQTASKTHEQGGGAGAGTTEQARRVETNAQNQGKGGQGKSGQGGGQS